jgi:hypothetical protein
MPKNVNLFNKVRNQSPIQEAGLRDEKKNRKDIYFIIINHDTVSKYRKKVKGLS